MNGGQFDISVQVTIPNEWKNIAPLNIGYTAGIETTKVAQLGSKKPIRWIRLLLYQTIQKKFSRIPVIQHNLLKAEQQLPCRATLN